MKVRVYNLANCSMMANKQTDGLVNKKEDLSNLGNMRAVCYGLGQADYLILDSLEEGQLGLKVSQLYLFLEHSNRMLELLVLVD